MIQSTWATCSAPADFFPTREDTNDPLGVILRDIVQVIRNAFSDIELGIEFEPFQYGQCRGRIPDKFLQALAPRQAGAGAFGGPTSQVFVFRSCAFFEVTQGFFRKTDEKGPHGEFGSKMRRQFF